jgi:hypothetical protein
MRKRISITFVSVVGLGAVLVLAMCFFQAEVHATDEYQSHLVKTKAKAKPAPLTLEKIHFGNIPMVSVSIDKALKALKSGDSKTASVELNKAKKMLVVINKAIGKHVKPKFANVRCPIMGAPIKPNMVTRDLIREYKGQKVAFCCAGCPAMWDKLSDSDKTSKLAKVTPTLKMPSVKTPHSPKMNHSGHKH